MNEKLISATLVGGRSEGSKDRFMATKKPVTRRVAKRQAGLKRRVAEALPAGYAALLDELKIRIRTAQIKAALAANSELIGLYWQIGQAIVERQRLEGWGRSVIE